MQIVLIDDTPEHLELLTEFVSELRPAAQVWPLQDGRSLPAFLAQHRADLVMMDLMMPHISGYELARWLRAENDERLPIIAISALQMPNHDEALQQAGFTDALRKPYEFHELARLLDQHLPA